MRLLVSLDWLLLLSNTSSASISARKISGTVAIRFTTVRFFSRLGVASLQGRGSTDAAVSHVWATRFEGAAVEFLRGRP